MIQAILILLGLISLAVWCCFKDSKDLKKQFKEAEEMCALFLEKHSRDPKITVNITLNNELHPYFFGLWQAEARPDFFVGGWNAECRTARELAEEEVERSLRRGYFQGHRIVGKETYFPVNSIKQIIIEEVK